MRQMKINKNVAMAAMPMVENNTFDPIQYPITS